MKVWTICSLLLAAMTVLTILPSMRAQDGQGGVKTRADLEQVVAAIRSGKIKGEVLFKEGDRYSVDTSYFHADKKMKAQSHADTDEVFVVQSGSAKLTLGGEIIDPSPERGNSGEPRGNGIKGGTSRQVSQGDMVNIPRGVAHLVDPGDGYILYTVVKIHGK